MTDALVCWAPRSGSGLRGVVPHTAPRLLPAGNAEDHELLSQAPGRLGPTLTRLKRTLTRLEAVGGRLEAVGGRLEPFLTRLEAVGGRSEAVLTRLEAL